VNKIARFSFASISCYEEFLFTIPIRKSKNDTPKSWFYAELQAPGSNPRKEKSKRLDFFENPLLHALTSLNAKLVLQFEEPFKIILWDFPFDCALIWCFSFINNLQYLKYEWNNIWRRISFFYFSYENVVLIFLLLMFT